MKKRCCVIVAVLIASLLLAACQTGTSATDFETVSFDDLVLKPAQYTEKDVCTAGIYLQGFETSALGAGTYEKDGTLFLTEPLIWIEGGEFTSSSDCFTQSDDLNVQTFEFCRVVACGRFVHCRQCGHLGGYAFQLTRSDAPAPTAENTAVTAKAPTPEDVSHWPVYRHDALGVQIRYPPGWSTDVTTAFARFTDPNQAGHSFDVVNAGFAMNTPDDFMAHLGLPAVMTETLVLDGQPALYVGLASMPGEESYRAVVAVVTPDGRGLTIGNKTEAHIFQKAVTSISFFTPTSVPP